MEEVTSDSRWRAEMRQRMPAQWALKLFGISTFMTAFFVGYFLVLRHPIFPVTTMPLIALDRLVPFDPGALSYYFSLWLFVLIPPSLMGQRRELLTYGAASSCLAVVGLAFFVLWPTSVPAGNFSETNHWALAYLKQIDATGNACPSLHVAFAVSTAIWLGWLVRDIGLSRWFTVVSWGWCLAILYSTMATRQHVALDVLAGTMLGIVVPLAFRSRRTVQRTSAAIAASG